MKYGHGVEKTLVGAIFRGQWERGRKHATGTRKLPFGLTEEQVRNRENSVTYTVFPLCKAMTQSVNHCSFLLSQIWKSGQLQSDPARMTAVELPFISRITYDL